MKTYALEGIAKLHDREKSMILSQVEKRKHDFSVPTDGGLPERVGEEVGSQPDSKGRFCSPKSFAIPSLIFSFSLCVFLPLYSAQIEDKVLICGIARNIEKAVPNTMGSITKLASHFLDYRVIIYENNSTDKTRCLFEDWAHKNPKVIFITEKISKRRLIKQLPMKVINRTEQIARARNIVLDRVKGKEFDDYEYVIWADLDFLEPWDVPSIIETIVDPEQPWDAVFAYGGYDLFALRTPELPIGFELLGLCYWKHFDEIKKAFVLDRSGPWKKVYSAFGGLGIYKRTAILNCSYSGTVTQDLETVTIQWLEEAKKKEGICFFSAYQDLLAQTKPIELWLGPLRNREKLPSEIGVRRPKGTVVWFSCTPNTTLPWTCEHVPFHASMIVNGFDRLFINPKIRSGL